MNQNNEIVRTVEHDQVIVSLRTDGIVHVQFLPNTEITIEFQVILTEMYQELTNGQKALYVFEGGEFVSITKAARENAIKIETDALALASAIVVKNLAQKIIADFYYAVNKPKLPYKVFNSFDKAILWLKTLETKES